MILLKDLKPKHTYRKEDFDIVNIRASNHIIQGTRCVFFTKNNTSRLYNARVKGGVSFRPRHPYELVHPEKSVETRTHVFYREARGQPYEYLGLSLKISDDSQDGKDRNKLEL
jgi:hypothetical protein